MKQLFFLPLLLAAGAAAAQNVGIGTSNSTRAKLEVHGVAGTGSTAAIFGAEGLGVSLGQPLAYHGLQPVQQRPRPLPGQRLHRGPVARPQRRRAVLRRLRQ